MKLEAGAFGESGTGVATLVIRASKPTEREYTEEHNGYPSFFAWRAWLAVDCDREVCERGSKLAAFERTDQRVIDFARDACMLSCDQGDECPANERVIDQVLAHWDSWRAEWSEPTQPATEVKPAAKKTSKRASAKPRARKA